MKNEIKGFVATENLNRKTVQDKVLYCRNLNKTKNPHLHSFAINYIAALSSYVYSERLFSEIGNLYKEKRNRLLPKIDEKFYYSIRVEKTEVFCSIKKKYFAIVARFIFSNNC